MREWGFLDSCMQFLFYITYNQHEILLARDVYNKDFQRAALLWRFYWNLRIIRYRAYLLVPGSSSCLVLPTKTFYYFTNNQRKFKHFLSKISTKSNAIIKKTYQLVFKLLIRISHSTLPFVKEHSINKEGSYKFRDTAKGNIVSRRETLAVFLFYLVLNKIFKVLNW